MQRLAVASFDESWSFVLSGLFLACPTCQVFALTVFSDSKKEGVLL